MKKLTKRIYIGIFENCSLISRIGNPIVVPDNEKDSINVVNSISWLAGEIDKRYIPFGREYIAYDFEYV